jgi:hypothetical protein
MLHMVAIGWLWVMLMVSITEKSLVAGVLTFVCYGLLPCGLLFYVLGAPARRRRALTGQAGAANHKQESPVSEDATKPE